VERQLIADLSEKIWGAGSSRDVLVKRVADALREKIASGQLNPGARLISEIALARSLAISRPTLRETIRILVRDFSTSSTASARLSLTSTGSSGAGSIPCGRSPT
jgi:DNA-binding transcriptional regulator YhcF (GntR family)